MVSASRNAFFKQEHVGYVFKFRMAKGLKRQQRERIPELLLAEGLGDVFIQVVDIEGHYA